MAFKLTTNEARKVSELEALLDDTRSELNNEIVRFNETVETLMSAVNNAVDKYNDAIYATAAFCEDIAASYQAEWDEKSEKWQEGDAGDAAANWISQWESHCIEQIEPLEAPTLDEIDSDAESTLTELPSEA
jgi:hypothetical protein